MDCSMAGAQQQMRAVPRCQLAQEAQHSQHHVTKEGDSEVCEVSRKYKRNTRKKVRKMSHDKTGRRLCRSAVGMGMPMGMGMGTEIPSPRQP